MRSLVLAVAALILVSACSKNAPPPRARSNTGGSETLRPAGPNWSAMMKKVRNLEPRRNKIIELMQDAVSEYDHYKRSAKAGSPDIKRLNNAKNLKGEAGDLYDVLREDVARAAGNEDLGDKLWDKRMRSFQTTFDKLSKKVRRIEFINPK